MDDICGSKKTKREKIVLSCEYYKKILKKWDNAILKAEGRKPGKNDLKHAPEQIQKAYKKYYKLVKYLQVTSSTSQHRKSSGKSHGLTPIKIFDGTYPTSRENYTNAKEKASTSKLRDTRLFRQASTAEKNQGRIDYNRFSEKIFNVVNILGKEPENKAHRTTKVLENESEEEVTRTALIANRFASFTKKTDSSSNVDAAVKDSSACDNNISDSSGNSSLLIIDNENEEGEMDLIQTSTAVKVSTKLSSMSAVWQNLSPNPKSKTRKSDDLKHVDSGWLHRCGMELDGENENDVELPVFDIDKMLPNEVELSNSVNPESEKVGLYCQGFQTLLLSGISNSDTTEVPLTIEGPKLILVLPPLEIDNEKPQLPFESESGDSGIGLGLAVSTMRSQKQDMQDVFDFDSVPCSSNKSVEQLENEREMFYNDNACPPPESYLQTIDQQAISDILTSSPFSYSNSIQNPPDLESNCRKRPAFVAFSPSPEKLEPKRKFFKSDRSHLKTSRYTRSSYKPETPVKKKATKNPSIVHSKSVETVGNAKTVTQLPTSKNRKGTVEEDFSSKDVAESASNCSSPPSVSSSSKKSKNPTVSKKTTSKTKSKKIIKATAMKKSVVLLNNPATNEAIKSDNSNVGPSTTYDQNTTSEYYDELTAAPTGRKGTRRARLTNKEHLQRKINTGKLNENFVRVDITKKVFVRGRKKISGAKVKRNDWKMKKASSSREEKMKSMTCRKCGEAGHFAKFCMKDSLPKEEPDEIDDSPFPTLEEVARMSHAGSSKRVNVYKPTEISAEDGGDNSSSKLLEVNNDAKSNDMEIECQTENSSVQNSSATTLQLSLVPPYFGFESGSIACSQDEEEAILRDTLKKFGYDDFRSGQLEAISRVLKGLSTVVILSTGSGKSLCYQLPAYLYAKKHPGALTICISPLVSLMEDQVQGIPHFLEAACLHSNMSSSQKEKVLERIRSKKLHILLVSPEAVCGGLFGLLRGVKDLPRISFACIDEVHCVSQWSHNFRPCYLQLCKILREKLNINTILGLTATATESTAISVCEHLHVDPSTTIRGEIVPCNLHLSVSRDTYREEGLLALLRGERFKECESIIIYCTRREECQRIACLIRTNLQDVPGYNGVTKTNLRQRVSNNCEAYHAGMTAGRRKLVQQQFMSGKIRIVVATVAFGMGIDKSDIRTVIHYNMPKTFESYVQEIGRAGRDGLPAHCHLFLDNVKGRDLSELRRHVYSNSVDRPTLRKLLRRVFQACKCKRIAEISQTDCQVPPIAISDRRCPGHEVSFNINETVTEMDLPQENITTLLCYLELDTSKRWIEILPHTYETCKIHSYGGAKLLKSAALKCPPLAAAIALKKEKKQFKETDSYLEFNVIEVSSTLGWNSGIVKKELKNLEWKAINFDDQGNSKKFRKSGILVEFCDLAFHLNAPGDLTDEESDIVLDYLHKHSVDQEKSQLYQLSRVYQALLSISGPNVDSASDTYDEDKSAMLKKFIYDYFTQKSINVPTDWKQDVSQDEGKREEIRRDVQNLLSNHRDEQFTGRAIAKIFQGIPSPCFPSEIWYRNRLFWRKHLEVDFNFLCQIAGQEILRLH